MAAGGLAPACDDSGPTGTRSADPGACPPPGPGVQVGGTGSRRPDTPADPVRRVVLMGGGPEEDAAATGFAEAAGGGDLVILRVTGSRASYPGYFLRTLAPDPAPATAVTVQTLEPRAADDPAVLCRVARAEAIWLAGGDQWDYLGRWPPELHEALAQAGARGAAVGGTSAGAMVLGAAVFDAREGPVSSPEALADPLGPATRLSYPAFAAPELDGVVVDSHLGARDREGRLVVFLARFLAETDRPHVTGVGLDEGVALVVEAGRYQVLGPGGRGAHLYRLEGPVRHPAGVPLELDRIQRVRLEPGSEGAWPPDWQQMATVELRVRNGRVERVPPPG